MPVALAVASLAVTAKGMSDQKTAASRAAQAAKDAQVNPQAVAQQASDQAIQNARSSAALEKELNPLAPQLRNQSLQAVIDSLKGGKYDDSITSGLVDQFHQAPQQASFQDYGQSGLSQASQAEAMRQLQLGGKLDQETANQVIRSSAAHAGGFGSGLGLGRDLSARDLGLTSIGLQQQRLGTAQQFGAAQDAFTAAHANAQNNFGLNNLQLLLQQLQQRQNLGFGLAGLQDSRVNADSQRAFSAAQLGQSIAQPVTGLDPGAIANLAVGNSNAQMAGAQNAAAIKAQQGQGYGQLGGQLFGLGASMYNPYQNQTSTLPATTVNMNTAVPVNGGVPFNGMIKG